MFLRQSTAVTVRIGPALDSVDGNTAETGLTIAQADVRLSKNNGAFAQKNDATACTHEEAGYYQCPINVTDTGTIGPLTLAVHVSGALALKREFVVLDEAVYDVMFGTVAPSTYAGGAVASVAGAVGSVTGAVGSVTGAVGSVAGNVGGNVGGNVVGNLLGTLTTTERTAIANAVETEIIDETDSEKVLAAITDKIASVNPSLSGLTLAAIAAAVRDVNNASPAASSLGAAVNAIPTAAANGAATLAATADGVAVSTVLARLNALARGLVSVTNNGNGTYTLAFKLQDGTTTAFTLIYNPTTGART